MVYTRKITAKTRALVLYYRKESGFSNREIARNCHISPSSVARIWREDQQPGALRSKQLKGKKGRPRKVDARSVRKLIRCLKKSRKENPNLTVKTLVRESGLTLQMASRRTFSRRLNEKGYGFYQVGNKGLVTERDKILRMKYSRQMKRYINRNKSFWKDEVAFYLDGVSFVFKHNPLNSAIAPKARVWRKCQKGYW
jgi:transposase